MKKRKQNTPDRPPEQAVEEWYKKASRAELIEACKALTYAHGEAGKMVVDLQDENNTLRTALRQKEGCISEMLSAIRDEHLTSSKNGKNGSISINISFSR